MNEVENKSVVSKDVNDFVDVVERAMLDMVNDSDGEFENIHLEPQHTFTPGLYCRELTMYPGNRIVSKIHRTEHQFVMLEGKCTVYDNREVIEMEGKCHGITKAGTRRILLIHEKTTWLTFHPNPDNETLEQIEDRIIEKHDNGYLTDEEKQFFIQ